MSDLERKKPKNLQPLVVQDAHVAEQAKRKGVPSADSKAGKEIGGPKGLEPTRYGDWESKGRCYDF